MQTIVKEYLAMNPANTVSTSSGIKSDSVTL